MIRRSLWTCLGPSNAKTIASRTPAKPTRVLTTSQLRGEPVLTGHGRGSRTPVFRVRRGAAAADHRQGFAQIRGLFGVSDHRTRGHGIRTSRRARRAEATRTASCASSLLKGGIMERHPGFENFDAALDHYQRRELVLLDLVDRLQLENAHLQALLTAST